MMKKRHQEKKVSESWVKSRLPLTSFHANPRSESQGAELVRGLGLRGERLAWEGVASGESGSPAAGGHGVGGEGWDPGLPRVVPDAAVLFVRWVLIAPLSHGGPFSSVRAS